MPVQGLAYSRADRFLTPPGPVPVDRAALAGLADLSQVQESDPPFDRERRPSRV
jgi:hypothetical protein